VLLEYGRSEEIDNELVQIIVQCLFQLSFSNVQDKTPNERQVCQDLMSKLFDKSNALQTSALLPLLVHPDLPFENLKDLLEQLIFSLHNHHL